MKALLHKDNYELRINNYANVGDNKMIPNSSQEGKQHGITSNIITPRIPLLGGARGGFMILLLAICSLSGLTAQAQNNVGIGTTMPNTKAILELQATDKGLLVPRMTTVQMNSVATNATTNGLLIYNTDLNCFHYWNTTNTTWKSMCTATGIINSGDTVIINLLKADSIFAHYLQADSAFITNLFATYIQADSAYIKNLVSNYIKSDSAYIKLLRTDSIFTTYLQAQYIRTDSIYAGLGRFDSLVIKGLSIDSLIKQITSNYLNSKDTVVLKYLRADSIYTHILRADTAFIGYIKANTIQADTIIGGFGSFDSLYVGGQNILQTISDSIDAKAWLTKGNIATTTYKLGTLNARDLHIVVNNTEAITLANGTGNVGIGQLLPAAKLDVLGNIQFFGDLKPAGLPGNTGDILISQGLGVAPNWVNPSTIVLTTTVSNALTGTNLTTTVNGVTGAPIDLSTIAPTTTVSNTYNTTTGALSTTVNGVTGANVTLSTANNITDSIKAQAWLLKGNAGTVAGTNFIGTTDNVDLVFKRGGVQSGLINTSKFNTSFGVSALNQATTGLFNTAIGFYTLANNGAGNYNTGIGYAILENNTSGYYNIGMGHHALELNTTGANNVAIGAISLSQNIGSNNNVAVGNFAASAIRNTTTNPNMAIGTYALNGGDPVYANNTANDNVAVGYNAMYGTAGTASTGTRNVAVGNNAMRLNTSGTANIAIGTEALSSNTTGSGNTASGIWSLLNNTTGTDNVANGAYSLRNNTTGFQNVAVGSNCLTNNTTGFANTATGYSSLSANSIGIYNTANGSYSLGSNTTGENNTAYGVNALRSNTTGSNNTAIGWYAAVKIVNVSANPNTVIGAEALYDGDATYANNTANDNVVVGFKSMKGILGTASTGAQNVAVGNYALNRNTSGSSNTVLGYNSGLNNSTGNNNTYLGRLTGITNTTGSNNTLLGNNADVNSNNLTNAAAIGYNAKVGASNSMVLGGTGADVVNVGINTTTPNNKLEIVQGTAGNSGLRLTSMPSAVLIGTNASGDIVPSTTPNPANAMFWGLTGNSGTVASTNFIGTTDNVDLVFKRNGVQSGLINNTLANTSFGEGALNPATTGFRNTAIGRNSLQNNTTGIYNTALGDEALMTNSTGGFSVAIGNRALTSATAGGNVAVGADALRFTTTGNNNTGIGLNTFQNNTTGAYNTALGNSAGNANTIGNYNTFIGMLADATANNFSKAIAIGYNAKVGASNSMVLGGTGVDAVNVGVGLTTPLYTLHVTRNAAASFLGEFQNTNATGTGVHATGQNATSFLLPSGSGGAFSGNTTSIVADANAATGTAVRAMGNGLGAYPALVSGSGGAFSGIDIGVYGIGNKFALASDNVAGGYFNNGNNSYAYVGYTTGGTSFKINGVGTVSTIVKNTKNELVNLYCPESPEVLFQDFGKGTLVNGVAHINMDEVFCKNVTINDKHPLRVIIQLEGDCKGVFVTNKTKTSFDVKELQNGTSTCEFTYFVTANRADAYNDDGTLFSKFENVRYGEAPGPIKTANEQKVVAPINTTTKSE